MRRLLKQKQDFNLIDKQVEIIDPIPEFMFAYSYDDKTSGDNQDRIFAVEYDKIGTNIGVIKLKIGTFKLLVS